MNHRLPSLEILKSRPIQFVANPSTPPKDIYHAVVSSSFDADRLDYLQRDRLMTGTGAGAIDFDWLLEHVKVSEITLDAADEDDDPNEQTKVETFCLDKKALPAAEQFLLARYTLHEQVYFHKATRCIESMIALLFRKVSEVADDPAAEVLTGLDKNHALLRFFRRNGGDDINNYLALDDVVVMAAWEIMSKARDPLIKALSHRLRNRNLFKTLDINIFGHDDGKQAQKIRKIDGQFKEKIESGSVIKDEDASVKIYTQIGGDDDKAHKKLYILENSSPTEITKLSKLVLALLDKKSFTRYYFENEEDRVAATGKKREKI